MEATRPQLASIIMADNFRSGVYAFDKGRGMFSQLHWEGASVKESHMIPSRHFAPRDEWVSRITPQPTYYDKEVCQTYDQVLAFLKKCKGYYVEGEYVVFTD